MNTTLDLDRMINTMTLADVLRAVTAHETLATMRVTETEGRNVATERPTARA